MIFFFKKKSGSLVAQASLKSHYVAKDDIRLLTLLPVSPVL